MAEQWLSISEYARRFSLSDMTVRRRIKNGRIHAVLKDGKYFIPATENNRHQAHDDSPFEPMTRPQQKPVQPMMESNSYRHMQPQAQAQTHLNSQIQLIKAQQPSYAAPIANNVANNDAMERQLTQLALKLDQALQSLSRAEAHATERYEARIKTLESDLRFKEREVKELLQQNEDLKLLLKFVEKKIPAGIDRKPHSHL